MMRFLSLGQRPFVKYFDYSLPKCDFPDSVVMSTQAEFFKKWQVRFSQIVYPFNANKIII